MKRALDKLQTFCKKNEVEINVDSEDIGLYFKVSCSDFSLVGIDADVVEPAVKCINEFRQFGFKTN